MAYLNEGPWTMTAGEAILRNRLVKLSAGTVVYNDAGDEPVGLVIEAVASGLKATVYPLRGGMYPVTANGVIPINGAIYAADDGKITATVDGKQLGVAAEAATANNAIITTLLRASAILDAGVSGETTFGQTLAAGSSQLTHVASTTKNYAIGTKRECIDGRRWRYSKALGVCHAGFGAWFDTPVTISHALPTQTGAATGLAGCSVVKVTVDANDGFLATGAIAADELVGGHIVIGNGGGGEATVQQRMITGNTVVAGGGGTTFITLDAPLTIGVSASDYCEVIDNQYAHMRGGLTSGTGEKASFGGVPAVITAANDYFWLQTKGPAWVCPNSNPGLSAADREVYWQANGTVIGGEDATVETGRQRAGYIIENSAAGDGPPFIFLQME